MGVTGGDGRAPHAEGSERPSEGRGLACREPELPGRKGERAGLSPISLVPGEGGLGTTESKKR